MAFPYVMRQANPHDLDTVLAIVEERALWLHQRGSDQWNQGTDYRPKLAKRVERGFTWLLEDDGEPIATVTIFRRCRSALWTPAEMAEPVLHAWKMATRVGRAGEGLTELLYEWGQDWAARLHLAHVRWSVWGASRGLQAHYQRTGAELIRAIEVPDRDPVALFQLPVRHSDTIATKVCTIIDENREGARELAQPVA